MRKIVKNRFFANWVRGRPRDCDSGDEELSQHFAFSDENSCSCTAVAIVVVRKCLPGSDHLFVYKCALTSPLEFQVPSALAGALTAC